MTQSPPEYLYPLLDRPTMQAKKPEAVLTMRVADELRRLTLKGQLRAVWFHVPNGEKRDARTGAILKAMGLIPGVCDFAFMWGNGCGLVELKAGRNDLELNQKHFRDWCRDSRVRHMVCRSLDEVLAVLRAWGTLA